MLRLFNAMFRHCLHPKPRGTLSDTGEFNLINQKAFFKGQRPRYSRYFIISDEHRDNWRSLS